MQHENSCKFKRWNDSDDLRKLFLQFYVLFAAAYLSF